MVAYVLHTMVSNAVQPFFPKDSPAWYALTGLALFFFVTWVFVRYLKKQGVYLFVCAVLGIPQVILTTLVLHLLGAGEISDEIANLIIRQCLKQAIGHHRNLR